MFKIKIKCTKKIFIGKEALELPKNTVLKVIKVREEEYNLNNIIVRSDSNSKPFITIFNPQDKENKYRTWGSSIDLYEFEVLTNYKGNIPEYAKF
jgi:hypothetical protein